MKALPFRMILITNSIAIACFFLAFCIVLPNASAMTLNYDSLNRLTSADYGNGFVIRYSYDAAGNRLTQTVSSIATTIVKQSTNADGTVTLAATASGAGTLTYQWFQGTSGDTSTPVVGATTATFTTAALAAPTSYWVRVSNGSGSVNGDMLLATLTDTAGPSLTVGSPMDGATVTASPYPIAGSASDSGLGDNGILSVTVNGTSAGASATAGNSAAWSASVPLTTGLNNIVVIAEDGAGNTTQKNLAVTYLPASGALRFGSVSVDGVTSSKATVSFSVNPNGFPATAYLRYGAGNYGAVTEEVPIGGSTYVPVSLTLKSLHAGTWYYFIACARNAAGEVQSSRGAFCTQAVSFAKIADFNGANGSYPSAGLVRAGDGNMYGTASDGGANGCGSIYRVTTAGRISVIHSFTGLDGAHSYGTLCTGPGGWLYGTAAAGGMTGMGTVFRCTTAGAVKVLHSFGGRDGVNPYAGLTRNTDGRFYGVAYKGGNGKGTIFSLSPSGSFSRLITMSSGIGRAPVASMLRAGDGNLYGTAQAGGNFGAGTLFKLMPNRQISVLHHWNGADGRWPVGALVDGWDGSLYGTTMGGGSADRGTIYKITPLGAFIQVYSFAGANGAMPDGDLVRMPDGFFYGTTTAGGANNVGTVFRMTSSGDLQVLHSFTGRDGTTPHGALLQNGVGIFYGTTSLGGAKGRGTVYQLIVP